MARRRSRKNAFHGHPLLHRWAALKGHRRGRKSRRTRRNAGSALSVGGVTRSATNAFHKKPILDAGALLIGSAATTKVSELLTHHFPVLASHELLKVALKLGVSGVVGKMIAPRVPYIKGYSSYVFAGGVLAGVIEGLRLVVPMEYLPKTGLGDDMDGMGWGDTLRGMSDWFVGPHLTSWALPNTDGQYDRDPYTDQRMGQGLQLPRPQMPGQHMGSFLHVGQPQVTLRGMADSLHMNQPVSGTGHQYRPQHPLQGLANMAVAEEMEMQA